MLQAWLKANASLSRACEGLHALPSCIVNSDMIRVTGLQITVRFMPEVRAPFMLSVICPLNNVYNYEAAMSKSNNNLPFLTTALLHVRTHKLVQDDALGYMYERQFTRPHERTIPAEFARIHYVLKMRAAAAAAK